MVVCRLTSALPGLEGYAPSEDYFAIPKPHAAASSPGQLVIDFDRTVTGDMQSRYDQALRFTLNWEGGYVDHPADPGGATNFGVTQAVYNGHRIKQGLKTQSVKLITPDEVSAIYLRYWDGCSAGAFALPLATVMFDTAINFGISRSIQFFQGATGLKVDGVAGPITKGKMRSLSAAEQYTVAMAIVDRRIKWRHERVAAKLSQKVFLKGWLRRDNALRVFATNAR